MADSPADARLEQLERRVRNDPMSVAFAALAEEYRRLGRLKEAIETCRTGLARHPAYLSARVTLGRALMETGALEQAQAELQQVVAAAPENLAAIRCLAEIHHRRGDHPEVEEHYRSALEAATQSASLSGSGELPVLGRSHAEPARAAEPAPPETAPVSPEPAASAYGEVVPDLAAAEPGAEEAAPPADDPALAGLEQWLAAIVAAREDRDEARSS